MYLRHKHDGQGVRSLTDVVMSLPVSPEPQRSQVLEVERVSLRQRPTLQLQSPVAWRPLHLHGQRLLTSVPVLNQQVLLRHESPAPFLHPQQVGERLRNKHTIKH